MTKKKCDNARKKARKDISILDSTAGVFTTRDGRSLNKSMSKAQIKRMQNKTKDIARSLRKYEKNC
jgi:hypothetical protein